MVYTVGETVKMLGIAPSALRYYDREGLLPFVERSSGGTRMFQQKDLEWLSLIHCLKKAGMSLKDIKTFIDMARLGDKTIEQRLSLFLKQREEVKRQIAELQETLEILNYKCWFYETAKKAGTTDIPRETPTEELPENLRTAKEKLYKFHLPK